ncbi:protein CHLOROPLAST IMPORT APPARATUS 2-like isoform X2 [Miscanthus floridulus]|uniref:protein CHLOROPLAST IMPORT APPARATUS 2-like isoform X2 n=1 Tax=Miscanthus floridulus TaxID=154761 RepID=UPI0034573EAF
MASSCILAGGIRLPDLEMVKAAPAAAPPRPAHSAASSTLSEASNASAASSSATSSSVAASLSLKRPRTPRKRPSQTYNEAAALLASMYPSVFPVARGKGATEAAAPPRLLGLASALADDPSCSDLLPPFPVPGGQAAFLLRDLPPPPPPLTPRSPAAAAARGCPSPAAVSSVFSEFHDPALSPATPDDAAAAPDEPGELDFDDDDGFDADSILCGVDEGAAEGIDGIMGKLSMENNGTSLLSSSVNCNLPRSKIIHPYLSNLMVLGLSFRHDQSIINQALKRHSVDPEWWMCPAIPVKDITPSPPPPMAMEKVTDKKTKKKSLGTIYEEGSPESANGDTGALSLPETGYTGALALPETGLGLSLNTDRVLKAWRGRGSVFADGNGPDLPLSSAHVVVKHEDSDLFPKNGTSAVIREGNILKMQRKQKPCTPLPSNKQTRYYRPRVKGRFVSKAYFLQQQQALEKES